MRVRAVAMSLVVLVAACTAGSDANPEGSRGLLDGTSTTVTSPTTTAVSLGPRDPAVRRSGERRQPPRVRTAPPTTRPTPGSATTTTLPQVDLAETVGRTVATVSSALSSGSGVLVASDILVSPLLAVWPSSTVAVTFPGGPTDNAPVAGYDFVSGMAVIDVSGLEDRPAPPSTTGSEGLVGKRSVAIVGAGGHTGLGFLRGIKTWPATGLRFLTVDPSFADTVGPGALVDAGGRLVAVWMGVVGAGSAYALSAPDAADRALSIATGQPVPGPGDRRLSTLAANATTTATVENLSDEAVWFTDLAAGQTAIVDLETDKPAGAVLTAPDGFIEDDIPALDPIDGFDIFAELPGPHFISVYPLDLEPVLVSVTADPPAALLVDPDHGTHLGVGETVFGNSDYPGDVDWFSIDLGEGQRVVIEVSSITSDPALLIDWDANPEPGDGPSDDDSGGGLLGTDARLEFSAPLSGSFRIGVFDERQKGPGGYVVTVHTP